MKKILFFVHNLGRVRVGGVERVASEIANELSKEREVIIFSALKDDEPFFEINKNVKLKSLGLTKCDTDGLTKLGKIFWIVSCFFSIAKVLFIYKSEAIYVAHSPRLGFLLSLFRLFFKFKLVVCEHQAHNSIKSIFYKKIRLLTYKNRVTVACLTERDKVFFNKNGILSSVIPNFVSSSLKPFEVQGYGKTLIYVGRLDIQQKRLDRMIEIIQASSLFSEGYELILAGEGPDEARLKEIAQGHEKIKFLKFSKNVGFLYRQGNIFLLTSDYEGFPLCLIEAMSQGLPCIAFDCDYGPREIIENSKNGYLINIENISDFIRSIKLATENPWIYSKLSRQSLVTAERFSIELAALSWSKIL